MLGAAHDNPALLRAAAEYIERHRESNPPAGSAWGGLRAGLQETGGMT